MDLFGPIFAMRMLALLLLDHSIMNDRIKELERKMKRFDR